MSESADIPRNLRAVGARIEMAAREAGRDPSAITLVAVSKTMPPERIAAAIAAGHRVFGENRVQEAEAKWPALRRGEPGLTLHLIGALQTNKVAKALEVFDVIETVDRPRLAEALARDMDRSGLRRECYIQVNTGAEPQKAGVMPEAADAFVRHCIDGLKLPVTGLMCIPPADEEPSLHFAFLREIARRHGLANLSMGMSADYPVAVAFGATHVRVGTAIFGTRPQKKSPDAGLGG